MLIPALLIVILASGLAIGAEPEADADSSDAATAEASAAAIEPAPAGSKYVAPAKKHTWFEYTLAKDRVSVKYSRRGLEVWSKGGTYTARIRWRTQLRFSYPFDSDPRQDKHYGLQPANDLHFRRARFKVEGHAIRPWLDYNFEHDLLNHDVLNLFVTVRKYEWLQFRAGQWKAEFSRERVTSSSKQQFADRSIVNREFTIDRQPGFEVLGHLMKGTRGDSWYYAGVFTGTGMWNGFEGAGHPMYLARYQWNFLGRDMDFSSSDLEYHDKPSASVAVAGVTNRSRYTRFSGSGGGQLDGFEPGAPDQYSLKQVMGEFFLKYRGLSVQNENHWKNIHDNVTAKSSSLRGAYIQAGYFPHYAIPWMPKKLEVGYRYGFVDPTAGAVDDLRQEHSAVVNYFFEGHDNKLTFDVGRLSLARVGKPDLSEVRYRIQWDVHF